VNFDEFDDAMVDLEETLTRLKAARKAKNVEQMSHEAANLCDHAEDVLNCVDEDDSEDDDDDDEEDEE